VGCKLNALQDLAATTWLKHSATAACAITDPSGIKIHGVTKSTTEETIAHKQLKHAVKRRRVVEVGRTSTLMSRDSLRIVLRD